MEFRPTIHLIMIACALHVIPAIVNSQVLSDSSTDHQFNTLPADGRWCETDLPYMQIYNATEYGGAQQNWDIIQDKRGVLYFISGGDLLEYDGKYWRQIQIDERWPKRYIVTDANGQIWLGGIRDVGYLKSDSLGFFQYESVIDAVPLGDRDDDVFWSVASTSQGVYFKSQNVIYRRDESAGVLKTWRCETELGLFFIVDEKLYVSQGRVGLLTMKNDSLQLVPGGERFANTSVRVLLP